MGRYEYMVQIDEMRCCVHPEKRVLEDFALNEAIVMARQEDLAPDTIHLWESREPLIVLPKSAVRMEGDIQDICNSKDVKMTRGPGIPSIIASGPSILNFAFIVKSQATSSVELRREIDTLANALVGNLPQRLAIPTVRLEGAHLRVDSAAIGSTCTYYYFDHVLLYGSIFVDDEIGLSEIVNRGNACETVPLCMHTERDITCSELKKIELQDLPDQLGVKLITGGPTSHELELAKDLVKWKYTSEDWIQRSIAPLTLGKILLEIYLAYPPTKRDRQIIDIAEKIADDLKEKVELRIWLRGKGLVPWLKGIPPGLSPSGGIVRASKKHIVPVVAVDGNIVFERVVPNSNKLHELLEKAYIKRFGGQ